MSVTKLFMAVVSNLDTTAKMNAKPKHPRKSLVRAIRLAKRWTLGEMARQAGIGGTRDSGKQIVTRIENGLSSLDEVYANAFSKALGLSTDELLKNSINDIELGRELFNTISETRSKNLYREKVTDADMDDFAEALGLHAVIRAPEVKMVTRAHQGFFDAGAEPFVYDPTIHPQLMPITPTQSRYRVLNRDLSEDGLVPGQIVTVDEAVTSWRELKSDDNVLVSIGGELQWRKYIAPDLLITNSSGPFTGIRISQHDVTLIGKAVGYIGW